ncbi:phasin family protein [Shimia sp.]|uniref:phasin family protein n=1 Tax=Shimia sp. TaxID=1954381 RepID=UPI003568453A
MTQSKTETKSSQDANAAAAFNPMAATLWQDVLQESARFITERLQKDLETQQAMLGCKSPAELLQLQTDFYQSALADYTEQTTRMLKLMSKAGGTSREYDDIPL